MRLDNAYFFNQLKTNKMTTLKKFTIWTSNKFGIGCFTIKAKDFTDAFIRLGKKDKMKDGWITDEDGESTTFKSILGIEEL